MKRPHDEHVGMVIKMLDDSEGRVVKVSEKGYRLKVGSERVDLPLDKIRWTKSNKLFEDGETDLTGRIMLLQNCGPALDGMPVKIVAKLPNGDYNFKYTTGCGSFAPVRCFAPVLESNPIIKVDKGQIVCTCCEQAMGPKHMQLFYVTLRDGFRQGAVCNTCEKIAAPLLKLVQTTMPDGSFNQRVGATEITEFDKRNLVELNDVTVKTMKELAERHGLKYTEQHKQIRPTAMEYTIVFATKQDEPAKPTKSEKSKKGISAVTSAKTVNKISKGLEAIRTKKKVGILPDGKVVKIDYPEIDIKKKKRGNTK